MKKVYQLSKLYLVRNYQKLWELSKIVCLVRENMGFNKRKNENGLCKRKHENGR